LSHGEFGGGFCSGYPVVVADSNEEAASGFCGEEVGGGVGHAQYLPSFLISGNIFFQRNAKSIILQGEKVSREGLKSSLPVMCGSCGYDPSKSPGERYVSKADHPDLGIDLA